MDAKLFTTNTLKTNKHGYYTRASIGKIKKPNYTISPDPQDDSQDDSDYIEESEEDDDEEEEEEEEYDDEEEEEEKHEEAEEAEEEEEEVEIDVKKYRELLADLFPSKFSRNKAIKTKKTTVKSNPDDYNVDYINPYENRKRYQKKKNTITQNTPVGKTNHRKNRVYRDESKTESDHHDQEQKEEEEEEEEIQLEGDEEENKVIKRQGKREPSNPNNIHFMVTIGDGKNPKQEYYDDENEYDAEYEEDEQEEAYNTEEELELIKNEEESLAKLEPTLKKLKNVLDKFVDDDKKMHVYKKMMKEYSKKEKKAELMKSTIDSIVKTQNTRKFQKSMSDKSHFNDVEYFRDKMTPDEQKHVLDQLEEIKSHTKIEKPYKLALLDASIPVHVKSIALKKINILKLIDPSSGEFYKIKNWIDTFMQIPFGKFSTLPVTIDDGIDKCHDFMENAKTILDNAVYGLNDAKIQIMQMIGQWIANPKAFGSAIAIKGPMGTGKTSLVKEGISKILEREFAFVALGGASDGSFLEGHSYTYEGSVWGRIVDILIKSKSMNPVIFFDELDKVSETARGDEIIGILTHLTDSSQNSKFHDKYFGELEFDLSRCLFIFSYNDENKINPILRDRMYRIQTSGYDVNDKLTISSQYLIPKIQDQVRFDKNDIIIPDDTIRYIVSKNTENEQGVRNLKRCLEIIYMKLNLYRLLKPGTVMFKSDMMTNVTFPITVTTDIVDHLIKQPEENISWRQMFL